MGAHSFFCAETATALYYQPKTADVALPLTISRPTPSGRLIRHRAGSTCHPAIHMPRHPAIHLISPSPVHLAREGSELRTVLDVGRWRGLHLGS